MDSDNGFVAPTLIPYVPTGSLQVPSNVTRIHRSLSRRGPDGTHQIMYYHSGVGTGSTYIDTLTGGLLGTGISENIREGYAFLAMNYSPGDEIILIGFSRGAFTARSIALMIKEIGLLTPRGMYDFTAVFKDQENFRNEGYKDELPTIPFSNKPKPGPNAAQEYKQKLVEAGLTRVYDENRNKIKVKCCAVWDTVGSLGIPQLSILAKFGLPHATKEYRFFDTKLSGDDIEHAFQALALDEHRKPFSPAVWEKDETSATDLRQVWFSGAHSNVGGGYDDQEVANISMVWMMDQLTSIGLSFDDWILDELYTYNVKYYENLQHPSPSLFGGNKSGTQFATQSIYEKYKPIRPWGLGKIYNSLDGAFWLTGGIIRSPGLYKRPDPQTGILTHVPMEFTHERIHSSVRTRLQFKGLNPEDHGVYDCPALLQSGPWELKQKRLTHKDPIPRTASWGPGGNVLVDEGEDGLRWVWEYAGPEKDAPKNPEDRILAEEPLGPYERYFYSLRKETARSDSFKPSSSGGD